MAIVQYAVPIKYILKEDNLERHISVTDISFPSFPLPSIVTLCRLKGGVFIIGLS